MAYSLFNLANPVDVSTEKKKSVLKASADKKAALSPEWAAEQLNDALLNDFDTYNKNRLGTNEKEFSLDALESSDFRYIDPKTKQPRDTDNAKNSLAQQKY
ncbi:MAG: hypothetical protein DRH90_24520 [Deltaproteobacteria bacterium]|nr:MAG: hypothetical protein DRH90_24520 [Deltaproteobacteria bacterium]